MGVKLVKLNKLEEEFVQLWEDLYPDIILNAQYPIGRYRVDFYHQQARVIIEIQGGTWVEGLGHSSGSGIEKDYKRFCRLASEGFLIFPLTCKMIEPEWLEMIAAGINLRIAQKL